MNWNAWILPVVLGGSLSSIYFLPQAGKTAESAARMELPKGVDEWQFEKMTPSKEEIETLGNETDFAKARCLKPRPGEMSSDGLLIPDLLDLSIVLSGSDLNTSIHRPERCMPAQGHTIVGSRDVSFDLSNGRSFEAKRLLSVKTIPGPEKGSVAARFNCVTYYFFVGHDQITNDHLKRTLIDMKDRLVRGMDQRWAYVSVSMMIGKMPWIEKEVTEEEADEKIRRFITGFSEGQIIWDQVKP
jgi:hypothetical protein